MGESEIRARKRRQIGALPYIRDETGRIHVMLVTSREARRWVIPKGWPIKGKKPYAAAEVEAFEEAGLIGRIGKAPVGSYDYDKRLAGGSTVPCEVIVFPLDVTEYHDTWPEMAERERRWFSPEEAANSVEEQGLRQLLMSLGSGGQGRR